MFSQDKNKLVFLPIFPPSSIQQVMKKLSSHFITLIFLLIVVFSCTSSVFAASDPAPIFSASDVIASINAYRSANGLSPLTTNSLLTNLAQQQSNYQASIDYVTHTGADGSSPQSRATAAGYGNGAGFYLSEIIYGGYQQSVSDAMVWWKNSSLHNSIMLESKYTEIGAGVATNGDSVYFTAELGGVYGSAPVTTPDQSAGESTQISGEATADLENLIMPVMQATPQEDGSIIHMVQTGQTLWTIAAVYNIDIEILYELNDMNQYSYVFPGDQIIIKPASDPNDIIPTTSTNSPKSTQNPTSDEKILGTPISYSKTSKTPTIIQQTIVFTQSKPTDQNSESSSDPNNNLATRWIAIGAFLTLFIVMISSIFWQMANEKSSNKDSS